MNDFDSLAHQLLDDLLMSLNIAFEGEIQAILIAGTVGLLLRLIHILLKEQPVAHMIFCALELTVAVFIIYYAYMYISSKLARFIF